MVVAELEVIRASAFVPSLIFLWIITLISFPIITWFFKSKTTKWGMFWSVWGSVALLSGMILLFIIDSPEIITNVWSGIKEFIRI